MVIADDKTISKVITETMQKAVQLDEITQVIQSWFSSDAKLLVQIVPDGAGFHVYSKHMDTGHRHGNKAFNSAAEMMVYILQLAQTQAVLEHYQE